ncbi:MAG TPA: hypothetical protein VGQ13_05815 [Nitrososphaera sp.]|nr:hypothetical protein [Nitrososphaera sp.]
MSKVGHTNRPLYVESAVAKITLDFTRENNDLLYSMLKNRFPDYVVMNEWKNEILESLRENLHKEGFTDEEIRKIARAVWDAFKI